MSSQFSPDSSAESLPLPETPDEVEELLASCLEGPSEHWAQAFERACQEHPQHAEELQRRLRTLRELGIPVPGETPQELSVPDHLGDFQLLRKLGAGGMGVVYLARQESLGREVALKLIRPDHLYFPGARQRFRREVEAVSRLRHPGIVPVHLVGEERGIPYFAMEWLLGCTLEQVLAGLGSRSPESLTGSDLAETVQQCTARIVGEEVALPTGWLFEGNWVRCSLRIAAEVARTLEHAHRQGVLHRDVKPSNILLTVDGRVMLLDFGVASTSEVARLTKTGTPVGSVPYMSPEQIDGKQGSLDGRTDVYSLGATLYELLTLRLPFLADGFEATRQRVLTGKPDSPRTRNPAISWDAETVTLTAMEAEWIRRYPTAGDLARDLENVLNLRPVEAKRPGLLLRMRRWVQRHPTRSVALALGFLLLVVTPSVVAVALRQKVQEVQAAEQEARARTRAAEETADFLVEVLTGADPFQNSDPNLRVRDVLEQTVSRLDGRFLGEPRVRAALLHGVGNLFESAGMPRRALPLLEEAVDLRKAEYGPDSWEVARTRAGLIPVHLHLGDQQFALDLAEALLQESDEGPWPERDALDGLQNPQSADEWLAGVRLWRADALFNLGRIESAKQQMIEVTEALRALPIESSMLPKALSILGTIYLESKELAKAESALSEARQLQESLAGGVDLQGVRIRNRLAMLRANQGRREEALQDLKELERDAREILNGPHGVRAELWHNFAELYGTQRQIRQGIAYRERAYQAFLDLAGPNADTTALCGVQLATDLIQLGRFPQAEPILQRCLEKYRNHPDPQVSGVSSSLMLLAECRLRQGDRDSARSFLNRFGDEFAPRVVAARALLVEAELDRQEGNPSEARIKCERALEWWSQSFPAGSWQLQTVRRLLGEILHDLGEWESAENLLRSSFETLCEQSGTGAPETLVAARALRDFFEDQDRLEEAEELWEFLERQSP